MDQRLSKIEATIGAIMETLDRLEERVANLEHRGSDFTEPSPEARESEIQTGLVPGVREPLAAVMGTPTLVGRSLLVLAGAFLLRALTEGGAFAPATGVMIGVAYAAVWIVASALAASKERRASAGFYAACSAMIVGPLLFEAATAFEVFAPAVSATVLGAMTGGGLYVASRWNLQSSGWIFVLGGLMTAGAVATARPPGEAATALVVLLGLSIFWLGAARDWDFLVWVTAFAADLAVLRLTAIAAAPGMRPENFGIVHPPLLVTLQIALVVGYVGLITIRALRGRRPLKLFDFVQTAAVWTVGWGGLLQLAKSQGWGTAGLFLCAVVVALAAYFGAFGVVDRRQGRNRAFLYLSSLGLGLVLVGLAGLMTGASGAIWSVLALGVAAMGSRWDRVTLRVHATLLLIAAWLGSGFHASVVAGLGGDGRVPAIGDLLVFILTIATTMVTLVGRRRERLRWPERLPLTVMVAMTAVAIASAMAFAAAALLGQSGGSAGGTVALSAITVGLALLGSKTTVEEAGWLVYPFLAVTGLRMMVVDLSSGNTLVLVIALTAYGAALIVSTRLIRRLPTELAGQSR